MSQINSNAIDAEYPIPGRDNDSQGFRNNFAAIKEALAVATTEIADLQSNAVLKGELGQESATALENDIDSSLIKNGVHKQFYPVFADRGTVSSTGATIDLSNGPVQKLILNSNTSLFFSWGAWPTSTPWPDTAPSRVSSVRLILKAQSGTHTVNIGGTNSILTGGVSGIVKYQSGVTHPFVVAADTYTVIDVWTYNEGDLLFVDLVGVY